MVIVKSPNWVLSRPTKKVVYFNNELEKLVDRMAAAMRKAKGIGLAANQVGQTLSVIIIEVASEKLKIPLTVVVNPKLISASREKTTQTEGCLSLPGLEVELPRSKAVKIKGYNLKGKQIKIAAKGLFARIIQHEMDHLNGFLITDRGKIVNEITN